MKQPTKDALREQLALAAEVIINQRAEYLALWEDRRSPRTFAFFSGVAAGIFAVFMASIAA